jgi:hypothetical protein
MSIITTQVKAAEFKYSTAFIHYVWWFFLHMPLLKGIHFQNEEKRGRCNSLMNNTYLGVWISVDF